MQIVWDKNIEPTNKAEIAHYFYPFAWLIPNWVERLTLAVEGTENTGSVACSKVTEHYREVSITIRPRWFTEDDVIKQNAIVHELLHIYMNPLYDFSMNAIRRYSDGIEDGTRLIVFDEMECYLERSTCDLARVLCEKMK